MNRPRLRIADEIEAERAVERPSVNIIDPTSSLRDPATIPRRDWLYGRHYIRGSVGASVADGGIGKSGLVIAEGLAMAAGRNLLGVAVPKPLNVLYLSLEEPKDEIERRIAALSEHHKIPRCELADRFNFQSGLDHPIIVARIERGAIVSSDDLSADLLLRCFDVVIVDPFNRCHAVPENDNTAIGAVVNVWASIAAHCEIAVEIVHHVRKAPYGGQVESGVADARGASALVNAARTVRTLNRMSESEAQQAGVEDRWQYFRADDGKANYAPAGAASWYRIVPVVIGNGESVAAVTAWNFPRPFDNVTADHMRNVRELAREGSYRVDPQSSDWIGVAVAEVLDLDAETDKGRIKALLKVWFANGVLRVVKRKDAEFKLRPFVEPGEWSDA